MGVVLEPSEYLVIWHGTPVYSSHHVQCDSMMYVSRETVKSALLDVFSGPPHTGVYSPSVQVHLSCDCHVTVVMVLPLCS